MFCVLSLCLCSYNTPLCGLPEEPPEGDDWRHAGAVQEEEGRHALEAQAVFKITQIERSFPLDVLYQTAKQPEAKTQQSTGFM